MLKRLNENYLGIIRIGIQILLSLFFCYGLFESILDVNYRHNLHLIIIIITSIIGLLLIINCFYKQKKIEDLFLLLAIPLGLIYLFFQLPSYKPDEYHHLFRGYDIINGNFVSKKGEDNVAIIKVPKNFTTYYGIQTKTYEQLSEFIKIKADYKDMVETYSTAASNNFVPYSISNIGTFIAKSLSLNYFKTIYLSRLFNFIFYLIMGYFAIKIMPYRKYIIFACLLNPMVLMQATAVTADILINSLSIFYISYLLYLKNKDENISSKNLIALNILVLIISLCKYIYAPLFLLQFILCKKENYKFILKWSIVFFFIDVLLVYLLCLCNANYSNPSYYVYSGLGLSSILKHPLTFIMTLFNTFEQTGGMLIESMVGNLQNWFDVKSLSISSPLYLIFLFLTPFIIEDKENKEVKNNLMENLILTFTFLAIFGLMFVAFYFDYYDFTTNVIRGIQGRYFIPILTILLVLLTNIKGYLKEYRWLIILVVLYSNISIIINIINCFI